MKKLALIATVCIVLSALASPTSVMGSPALIEEPSFETVTPTIWVYDEDDGDYNGAQSSAWASQGTNSYLLSCTNAGIGGGKYAEIAQTVNFTLLDTIFFDCQLYSNQTTFEAQVWVNTTPDPTKVWSKAVPTATTPYLQESVDVSTYTGSLDLMFRVQNIGGTYSKGVNVNTYFDNIKIWGSYSDDTWQTVTNYFSGSTNHVYMYGENFDDGTTKVGYYDGADNLKETDTYDSWGGGTLSWSECLFIDYRTDTATAGYWHAVVLLQADDLPNTYAAALDDLDYVADDEFDVAASAIPEFPAAIAGIGVAGLCFGIYYWMRKRKLNDEG